VVLVPVIKLQYGTMTTVLSSAWTISCPLVSYLRN